MPRPRRLDALRFHVLGVALAADAAQVRLEVGLEQGAFSGPLSLTVDAVR